MDPRIRIRPFEPTGAEYEAVARLNALAPQGERQDFEPCSGADLQAFDASFDPARHVLRRYVAEEPSTGQIVGASHGFHMPWMSDPSRFWCAVRCEAAYRRRGIGGRLYAEIMADFAGLGAAAVRMMARETMPEMVALLTRRGYREVLRSWDFELELDRAHTPPSWAPPPGIVIEPLADLSRRDPAWLPRLHALYVAVMREVPLPGFPRADPPPEWLSDHLLRWPTSLPDACLVATDGSDYVGLCVMHRNEGDLSRLDHLLTGVSADHRGRGVGVALKLATIAHGKRRGYRRIWTSVESNNPGMLALNERVGFIRKGGLILFETDLGGG